MIEAPAIKGGRVSGRQSAQREPKALVEVDHADQDAVPEECLD
jgi:hypothetical protein